MDMTAPTRPVPVLVDPDLWPVFTAWAEKPELKLEASRAAPGRVPHFVLSKRPTRPGPGELTTRERQVLSAIAEGLPNGEIARRLFLSEDTVKTHAQKIYRKIGARDRASAVHRAHLLGLLGGEQE